MVVVAEENLDVVALSRGTDIIVLNEFLLLSDHIFQIDNSSGLKL